MFRQSLPWAIAGCCTLGCVRDLGSLEDGERPDPAPTPTFVVPERDAGAGGGVQMPAPAATVPAPVQPSPVSLEPLGRGNFTLLHGIVDARTIAFCVMLVDGDERRLGQHALPSGGLSFGQVAVLPMADRIEPASTEVRFFVVAADPDRLGAGCPELLEAAGHDVSSALPVELEVLQGAPPSSDAGVAPSIDLGFERGSGALPTAALGFLDAGVSGPSDAGVPALPGGDAGGRSVDSGAVDDEPPEAGAADAGVRWPELRVTELPRLLPTTYEDRTYLVAASGCLGAPGLVRSDEAQLCGPVFTRNRSSATALVFPLSRLVDFDAVGLQVAHSSLAIGDVTLRSNPGETDGTSFTLVSGLKLGNVAPWTAQRTLSVEALGAPLDQVLIQVASGGSTLPLLELSWAEALEPNHVELVEARAFTLVVIGGALTLERSNEFNPAFVAVVQSDPLR